MADPTTPSTPLPATDAATASRYAAALASLGCKSGRPKNGMLPVRGPTGRADLDIETARLGITHAIGAEQLAATEARTDRLAVALASTLGLPMPKELLRCPETVAPLLRPRLVERAALTGSDRTACRREAFADAFYTVAIGVLPEARLLRTEDIDRWHADFDDVLASAIDRLAMGVTPEHVHDLEGDDHLLAVVHRAEPTACVHLIFDRLLENHDPGRGVVFAMPTPHTCLCLPVSEDAGAPGLARLVRTAFALTPDGSGELAQGLYWHVAGRTEVLPLTHIEESAGRRVQIDAIGAVAELLRALGELG